MKKLLLILSLSAILASPVLANTQAENQMIELLRQIKDNGASSGGGSDVTVHDHGTTTQFLAIDSAGKLGINALPNVTIGAALPAGTSLIGKVGIDQTTPGTTNAVTTNPTRGAVTDRSGTITSGGTSQQIAAANSSRSYFEYQNISDETQYINFGAAATTDSNSFKIIAGASWSNIATFCPTGTINVIGATTGKKFIAKEG